MTTYPGLPGPIVCDFLSREASRQNYTEGTTFQIAKIELVANTGTYVDTPFHRFESGVDLADGREELRTGRRAHGDLSAGRLQQQPQAVAEYPRVVRDG